MQRDLRLVHEQQLAVLHRPAQGLLEAEALRRRIVERGAVEGEAVAAELLGAEQRDVGGAQQPFRVVGMVGVEACADAGAGGEHAPVDGEGLLQGRDDLLRRAPRPASLDWTFSSSTVNSSPPRRASSRIWPAGGAQARGDALQHAVAEAVAEGVVDGLEVVDVHEQQRQALPVAGARQRAGRGAPTAGGGWAAA